MIDKGELAESLRSTLGKLQLALDNLGEAIAWTGENGRVQWCNEALAQLVGRPRRAVLDARLSELLPLQEGGKALPTEAHPMTRLWSSDAPFAGTYEFQSKDSLR